MKYIIGSIFILLGLFAIGYGIYFGFVECFVGGIVDVINQIKANTVEAKVIAWAIVKIIFFELPIGLGWCAGAILMSVGTATMGSDYRCRFDLKFSKNRR